MLNTSLFLLDSSAHFLRDFTHVRAFLLSTSHRSKVHWFLLMLSLLTRFPGSQPLLFFYFGGTETQKYRARQVPFLTKPVLGTTPQLIRQHRVAVLFLSTSSLHSPSIVVINIFIFCRLPLFKVLFFLFFWGVRVFV